MTEIIPTFQSITPILMVETIEPCLPFWQNLGFQLTVTVPAPAGDRFAFAILIFEKLEIMYQTYASAEADIPSLRPGNSTSILYLHVPALEPLLSKLGDAEVVVPRRTTFYGADEIFVRTPGGHIAGFAAMLDTAGAA